MLGAGIKGRDKLLHTTVSVVCNCLPLPLIPFGTTVLKYPYHFATSKVNKGSVHTQTSTVCDHQSDTLRGPSTSQYFQRAQRHVTSDSSNVDCR